MVQVRDPKVNAKRLAQTPKREHDFTLTLIDSFLDTKNNIWSNAHYLEQTVKALFSYVMLERIPMMILSFGWFIPANMIIK